MSANENSDSLKMQRIERERKHRRNNIVEIAEGFFINLGYEQTMVDEIARKAGYSKATIYNYFESKDDLFIAVVSRAFEQLFQIMDQTLKESDVMYELRSLGDAYLIFVEEYPGYAGLFDSGRLSLVIRKIIEKEETNQPLTESETAFRVHQLKIQELMIDVITETIRASGIQTKIDPFSVVMALSTLNSAIRELVIRGNMDNQTKEKSREYLAVLFNIIDKGLKHYDD